MKTLSHIVLAVSDELLHLITECETAKAAWGKLQAHSKCDSLANHLSLNKKYLRTVMDENELNYERDYELTSSYKSSSL